MAGTELTKKRRIWKENGEIKNDPLRDYTGTITSGGNPNYEYIEEDAVDTISSYLPTLPAEGEWVEERTYAYNGNMVRPTQPHYRTIYDPLSIPSLFTVVRKGDSLPWIKNEKVGKDMIRTYDGQAYICDQPHTSLQGYEPPNAPALWSIYSGDEIEDWVQPEGAPDVYMKDDKVKHNGYVWQSNIDNNSWEPGVYGWTQIELV